MGDLFEAGFTKDQILDALRQLPVVSLAVQCNVQPDNGGLHSSTPRKSVPSVLYKTANPTPNSSACPTLTRYTSRLSSR